MTTVHSYSCSSVLALPLPTRYSVIRHVIVGLVRFVSKGGGLGFGHVGWVWFSIGDERRNSRPHRLNFHIRERKNILVWIHHRVRRDGGGRIDSCFVFGADCGAPSPRAVSSAVPFKHLTRDGLSGHLLAFLSRIAPVPIHDPFNFKLQASSGFCSFQFSTTCKGAG